MTRKIWLLLIALAAATFPALTMAETGGVSTAQPVTVFGAASLTDALSEIGTIYNALHNTGGHNALRFSFAASSTLARQIEAGAPAAIFVSASTSWMDYLEDRNLVASQGRISPIGNSLVLVAPADSPVAPFHLDQHAPLDLLLGSAGRLAMGDPAHVPAGIYARQALHSLGLWPSIQNRVAFGNDVRGVLALVERSEVPLGIVYATDAAISSRIRILATFPATTHDPIRYSFALTTGSQNNAEAAALISFMSDKTALEVFRRHGFIAP